MDVSKRFSDVGVIPVVVIEDAADAVPTAKALLAGGIDVMEITFRTAAARDAIAAVAKECPEMLVGAGTVLNMEQCLAALEAGANFIVAPGYSEEVVSYCVEHGVPMTPACVTPTEIMAALELGITTVKFFPANVYGGLKALKALAAPFPQVRFIPTGGVDRSNIDEFLAFDKIAAIGGSFFVKEALEKMEAQA